MIYYIIPTLLYFVFILRNTSKQLVFFLSFLLVLIMIIFGGLRDTVGSDWYSYYYIFNSGLGDIEVGSQVLIDFTKLFDNNYYLFVFFLFTTSFLMKCYFFHKLSKSFLICLIVYMGVWFIVFDINQIRQGLAIGLVSIALYHCYNEKFIFYCLFVLLAFSIHASSIIIFPFYFIINYKIQRKYMICIVCILVILAMYNIAGILVDKITNWFNIDLRIVKRLYDYSEDERYNTNILLSFATIHRFLVFGLTLFFINKIPASERIKQFILMSGFYYLCIYLCFAQFELIATRLSTYYKIMECIFLSYLPFISKKTSYQNLIAFCILLYVFMQIYVALQIPNGGLIPYSNLLETIF